MNFEDRLNSHIRLAILLSLIEEPAEDRLRHAVLRVLARIPGRSATSSMIAEFLADYGWQPARDEVTAIISWLDRSRLVKAAEDEGLLGAMLLDLGGDVAAGRATVPGVAPAPTMGWLQANLEAKSIRLGAHDLVGHVNWCRDHQLVTIGDGGVDPTPLGIDVALGRQEVAGVKAPSSATIMRLASNAALGRLGG